MATVKWSRFFVLGDGPGELLTPTAGGDVDGIAPQKAQVGGHPYWAMRMPDVRHGPYVAEAGEAFSSGASLATDADGRAVVASGGDTVVAEALEASSGAGDAVDVDLLP